MVSKSAKRRRRQQARGQLESLAAEGNQAVIEYLKRHPEPAVQQPAIKSPITKKRRKKRRYPNDFYSTEEWKQLRYAALVASDGRCQCCSASAKDGAVLRVDHIIPISKAPHLKADPANFQILCNDCNWGKGSWDFTDWRYTGVVKSGETTRPDEVTVLLRYNAFKI